jgi:crotonobetainyl-CoA:carnitine CoA-transferase CaiB-like acyl-CoA transferase
MGIATEYVAATTAMAWFTGVLVALLAVIAALHASARRGPQLAAQPSPPAGGR